MTEDPSQRATRRRAGRALRWVLLGACAWFLVRFFARHGAEIVRRIELRPGPLVLLVAVQIAYLIVQGGRYRLVLERCAGRGIGAAPFLRLYVLGRFLNQVVPQAGNVYRALALKSGFGVSYTSYVASLVSFAWLGTLFNLLASATALAVVAPRLRVAGLPAAALVVGLALVVAAGPPAAARALGAVGARSGRLGWLRDKAAEALDLAVSGLRDARFLARLGGGSVLVFAAAVAAVAASAHALGLRAGLGDIVLYQVAMQLSYVATLTPANLGVTEIGIGLLAREMGLGMGEGILLAALLRVTATLALLALALPLGGLRRVSEARRAAPDADA